MHPARSPPTTGRPTGTTTPTATAATRRRPSGAGSCWACWPRRGRAGRRRATSTSAAARATSRPTWPGAGRGPKWRAWSCRPGALSWRRARCRRAGSCSSTSSAGRTRPMRWRAGPPRPPARRCWSTWTSRARCWWPPAAGWPPAPRWSSPCRAAPCRPSTTTSATAATTTPLTSPPCWKGPGSRWASAEGRGSRCSICTVGR
jgi:hypothetical protein